MGRYKVLGVNDDCDTCSHCGRTGLKLVVWLAAEGCDAEPVGRDCAARLLRTTAVRVQRAAETADRERAAAEAARVHEIGDVRSVRPFVVESVGQNGASVTTLALANGSKRLIEAWAAERWPHLMTTVRVAI